MEIVLMKALVLKRLSVAVFLGTFGDICEVRSNNTAALTNIMPPKRQQWQYKRLYLDLIIEEVLCTIRILHQSDNIQIRVPGRTHSLTLRQFCNVLKSLFLTHTFF